MVPKVRVSMGLGVMILKSLESKDTCQAICLRKLSPVSRRTYQKCGIPKAKESKCKPLNWWRVMVKRTM